MQCPKAVIFDLDNTLADPYRAPSREMAERLQRLIPLLPTAIMSAASLERMQEGVLRALPPATYSSLLLFTANAAQAYAWSGSGWAIQYRFDFEPAERARIEKALHEAADKTDALDAPQVYGKQFVDYEGYVAFTALGTDAPAGLRSTWDPDQKKRRAMKEQLDTMIPEFDVLIGGATTIDITRKGINKAHGVRWLAERLKLQPQEMLYVGDALYEGGNDAVVTPTGIQTRSTTGPAETLSILDELITACAATA